MAEEYPKLRYLEPVPFRDKDQVLIALRDPAGISDRMMIVPPAIYEILAFFDGRHSVLDVQVELTRRHGEIVFRDKIDRLLAQLDEIGFLENETFRRRCEQLSREFREQSVRRPFHSPSGYPADAGQLSEMLGSFYTHERGAGLPGERSSRRLRAIVAPHIDFRLGGPTYTHAYRALAESEPPDVFVILGTGHLGLPEFFSVSPKDFETPLGTVETDRELLRIFREEVGDPLFDEHLAHRSEHTIEFQTVFLKHLFPNSAVRILPVLTSFAYGDVDPASPARGDLFQRWVDAYRTAEQRSGLRVCLVASVDLAHIGPRYGDEFRPGPEHIDRAGKKDGELLATLTAAQPEEFRRFVAEERDRRRICGFAPLYAMLHLLEGLEGELLDHNHGIMDESGSFVTFASAVFELSGCAGAGKKRRHGPFRIKRPQNKKAGAQSAAPEAVPGRVDQAPNPNDGVDRP